MRITYCSDTSNRLTTTILYARTPIVSVDKVRHHRDASCVPNSKKVPAIPIFCQHNTTYLSHKTSWLWTIVLPSLTMITTFYKNVSLDILCAAGIQWKLCIYNNNNMPMWLHIPCKAVFHYYSAVNTIGVCCYYEVFESLVIVWLLKLRFNSFSLINGCIENKLSLKSLFIYFKQQHSGPM